MTRWVGQIAHIVGPIIISQPAGSRGHPWARCPRHRRRGCQNSRPRQVMARIDASATLCAIRRSHSTCPRIADPIPSSARENTSYRRNFTFSVLPDTLTHGDQRLRVDSPSSGIGIGRVKSLTVETIRRWPATSRNRPGNKILRHERANRPAICLRHRFRA